MSEHTFYRCRNKYDGMELSDAPSLKAPGKKIGGSRAELRRRGGTYTW